MLETDEEDDVPSGEASELADHWPRARMKNENMIITSAFLPWGMRMLVCVPGGAEMVELEKIPMTGKSKCCTCLQETGSSFTLVLEKVMQRPRTS